MYTKEKGVHSIVKKNLKPISKTLGCRQSSYKQWRDGSTNKYQPRFSLVAESWPQPLFLLDASPNIFGLLFTL